MTEQLLQLLNQNALCFGLYMPWLLPAIQHSAAGQEYGTVVGQ